MNQEEDLDVRWADQEQINEFGRLNNRLLEIRAESKQAGIDAEKLDDATAELMMATSSGDAKVMLLIGESFIESTEDEANDCESMSLGGSFAWRKGPRHSRCQKSTDLYRTVRGSCILLKTQIASASKWHFMTALWRSRQKKTT